MGSQMERHLVQSSVIQMETKMGQRWAASTGLREAAMTDSLRDTMSVETKEHPLVDEWDDNLEI